VDLHFLFFVWLFTMFVQNDGREHTTNNIVGCNDVSESSLFDMHD